MTGGGFRTFTAGEVLTAANVNDFFMDQAVMNFSGTAARAAALPSPSAGMVTHIGGGTVQVYNGTAWVALGGVPAAQFSNTPSGSYTSGGTAYSWIEFTSSGTLTVTRAGFADVLIVGGGGGGGTGRGGGGGGGGHLYATDVYLPTGTLTVTVGAGGAGGVGGANFKPDGGKNGRASRLGNYYSPGGGGGSDYQFDFPGGAVQRGDGNNGGSGGGATGTATAVGGAADLGNAGGNGANEVGAGGGGAGGVGSNAAVGVAGNGGAGTSNSITNVAVTRAGGGGGGISGGTAGTGGTGGGGAGSTSSTAATNGTANSGGGGGGGGNTSTTSGSGGSGGSGVVIIRVKT